MLPHSVLRYRLNTTLSPIQPLLKLREGKGILFLPEFGSVPGRELCQLWIIKLLPGAPVFSLEDSHLNRGGMVLLKLVRSEKIKDQGRTALAARIQQNQPLHNDCAAGFPGKTHQSSRGDGHEENHSWGENSADTGLDAAVLWLGERLMPLGL